MYKEYACFKNIVPLMYITSPSDKYSELEQTKLLMEGGCNWVQLRMKGNLCLETAQELVGFCASNYPDNVICIDDNPEIAMKSKAYTVHLGKRDMPVAEAWQLIRQAGFEDRFIVGATANTFEDIVEADRQGASYIGLGPYRFTQTKKNLSPILGLEGYERIMKQCREAGIKIPVFAIGGIRLEDVDQLMQTGITGIAVSSSILQAEDPTEETKRFIAKLKN